MKWLATLIFSLFLNPAVAENASPFSDCKNELTKYCPEALGTRESFQCLRTHDSELSLVCRDQIQRVVQMFRASPFAGSGAMGAMLGGGGAPGASYNASYLLDTPHIQQHRLSASMPVCRDESDTYSVSTNASVLAVGAPITLSNGVTLPTEFYRFDLGGSFLRRLENRKNFGLRLSVGSASDRPFGSFDELTFMLNATYSFPEGENGTWTVFVFMANNTSFANYIPIPGGMYIYRKDNFTGIFGLPFAAVSWTPDLLSLSFSVFGPFVSAEVGYGSRDIFQAYTGFNWSQVSHLRYARQEDRYRVFLDEKKFFIGGRFPILNWLAADLQLGHSFGRSLSERRSIFRSDGGEAKLPAAWYIQGNLALRAPY